MITIYRQELEILKKKGELIKDNMANNTCKTNLSPQLMFRQSFTGVTNKTFVGNWTKNGFWISKFRMQMFQLRPDIIADFKFNIEKSIIKLSIKYSIGFSSIFIGLIIIFMISLIFLGFGLIVYFASIAFLVFLYSLIASFELSRLRVKIQELIFY